MAVTNQTNSTSSDEPILKHHHNDHVIDRKKNDVALHIIRRRSSDSTTSNDSSSSDSGSDYECSPSIGKKYSRRSISSSSVTKAKDGEHDKDAMDVPPSSSMKPIHCSSQAKEYLDKRIMTSTQELFNSITMLPGIVYCLYFILAECWMIPPLSSFESGGDENDQGNNTEQSAWMTILGGGSTVQRHQLWLENSECLNNYPKTTAATIFTYMHTTLPPLPILSAIIGILAHSPISMLYHYKCATSLPPSIRVPHWSRRLDNAFIHFASCCAAYATSGRFDYFLLNIVFNMECAYRQFETEIKPRRNLGRIAASIGLYLAPVIVRGHWGLLCQFLVMFGMSGWLFVKYPFGGWSHGIFHIFLSFLPYLVIKEAMQLESTQIQISLAMKCAGM